MSPWKQSFVRLAQDVVRLSIWLSLATVALSGGVFLAWFAVRFLVQLAGWCQRTMFGEPW